jgi:tetratricopeptide (TPR) repeat protein
MAEARTQLQAARRAEGWSQARLLRIMKALAPQADIRLPGDESLKTELSRWENGHKLPDPCYRKLFRMIYGLTDEELGFSTGGEVATPRLTLPTLDHPVIDYYEAMLREHYRADAQMGPRYVLPIVEQQVRTLVPLLRELRGADRTSAIDLACRYEEFLGWLYQDTGQPEQALTWTARAYDLGLEVRNPQRTGYLLMRRSNIVSDTGDAAQALALADAALREHPGARGSTRAVMLRQRAQASAALQDPLGCASAIDAAFEALEIREDEPSPAPYCTVQYVAMEAGMSWLTMKRPDRALAAFSEASGVWPETSRRDQGLFMARLALVHAVNGDLDQACRAGQEALALAKLTGSARTLVELRFLRQHLRPRRRDPAASRLAVGIASLMGDGA